VARKGTFGRAPRSAPNFTNTLVSIAREYQAQRAENLMSSWQKGGIFEGKKATDEVVLAFWKGRMNGVSKDDPLHDTYSNAVTQLDYTIAESKMTAKYAQKGASDGQMVSFYMNWAKKVPKNSEFYRVLLRDAGQYMRTARANGDAERRRREEERYQTAQMGTQKKYEAAGTYITDTLRKLAQSGNKRLAMTGIIAETGSGSDLTNFDPSDPTAMMTLLDLIAPEGQRGHRNRIGTGEYTGSDEVLFHDDDQKAWTGKDILNHLTKLDPSYKPGQPVNIQYVTGLLDRQMQGLNERIKRAKDSGHMQDVKALTSNKEYVALLNRQVSAYPVQKLYQEARSDYASVVGDATASPMAKYNAWLKYSATLTDLSNNPGIESNDAMKSMLASEAAGNAGPTLNETFTGLADADFAGRAEESAKNKAAIDTIVADIDAVNSGAAVWTYGVEDSNGVFTPQAGGTVIRASDPASIDAGGVNAQTVVVADPIGGSPMTMRVTATPVYASAKNPLTGEDIPSTGTVPIAYAYDIPKGGKTVTTYGFQSADGFVFSENPPWADSLKTSATKKDGQNRLEVDFTPVVEQNVLGGKDPVTGQYKVAGDGLLAKDADLGGGFSVKDAGVNKPGTLVFNPLDAAKLSDERHLLATGADTNPTDPISDFHSLTLAHLTQDNEGMSLLSDADKNPQFKAQIDHDNYLYAGYVQNAKGVYELGPNARPDALIGAQNQTNLTIAARGNLSDYITKAAENWQRGPLPAATKDVNGLPVSEDGKGYTQLATDLIKATQPFAALGAAFGQGTSTLRKPTAFEQERGFEIRTAAPLKVPGLDAALQKVVQPAVVSQGPVAGATVGVAGGTSGAPSAAKQQGSSYYNNHGK
jgi:hypothetical protein